MFAQIFEALKPQIALMMGNAVAHMESKSRENLQRAAEFPNTSGDYIGLITRAGLWADAAAMIRESLTP